MEGVAPLPRAGSPEAEVEVLVAGAGPVGLLLGCILQRAGVNVLLVDPHTSPGQLSKAAVTMPRSFEVMDLVGAGAEAATTGRPVQALRLALGGSWTAELRGFTARGTPTRYGPVATGQPNVERILGKRFEQLGGRILRAARFVGFASTPGGVEATVERFAYARPPAAAPEVPPHLQDPMQTTIAAKYLVGCDGKQSGVRGAMGVGFTGKAYPQNFFLADALIDEDEVRRKGMDSHEMQSVQDAAVGRVLLMVHIQGKLWRTYYSASDLDKGLLSEEFMKEQCRQMLPEPGAPEMELRDLAFYSVDCRLADAYRKGPCLLAGDAAHCHSPAGGQGMNTGLQDAANLGWKLAAVLRQGAPEDLLDSYEKERRPCAEWVLSTSDRLFQRLMDQSSPAANRVRKFALTALTSLLPASALPPRFIRERFFGISINYAACGTCRNLGDRPPKGAIAAGYRLPDLPYALEGGGERFTLQLLEDPPSYPFLLIYVACSPPGQREVSDSLEAFRAHLDAGVPLRPCVYVAPAPCCLDGCFLFASAAPPGPSAGAPLLTAGIDVLRLAPPAGKPKSSLAAALRLPPRGRALLVVRPDGHIAVAQRGSWSGKEVVKAMMDLAQWPTV